MISRTAAHRLLAAAVLPAGFGAYALLVLWSPPISWATFGAALLFLLLYLVAGSIDLITIEDVSMSPEMVTVALGLLAAGPAVPAAALAVGSAAVLAWRRRPPLRIIYTSAQFGLALAAFVLVYRSLVGPSFGLNVPDRILAGDIGLGLRYVVAVAVGTTVYVAVNVGLLATWLTLWRGEGRPALWPMFRSDLSTSLVFALLAIPGMFIAASVGWLLAALFAIPALGAIWGGAQFLGARLGGSLTVARRLTAFFTAAVGIVFLALIAVVLGTQSAQYARALAARAESFTRGYVSARDPLATAGSAEVSSAVLDSAVARLLADDPAIAYVDLATEGERGRVATLHVSGRLRAVEAAIRADVERDPESNRRWFDLGRGRGLRVRDVTARMGSAELHLGTDLSFADAERRRLGYGVVGATLVLYMVLLLLLRYYLGTHLSAPLRGAGEAVRAIAEGDADLRRRLSLEGDEEIRALAEQFNRFVDRLSELVTRTAGTALDVAGGASDLATASEELSASAGEVSGGIERAVGRMEDERAQTEQLHELTSVLADLNREVADRTLEARRQAAAIVAEVERSRSGLEAAGESLLGMRQVVQQADAAGVELIRTSEQIEGLVLAISDLAATTNLLALNAAIEAARAGEQGSGFAVVADEVRKLADGSAQAAEQAGELVVQIKRRADQLSEAMRRGGERVLGVERTAADSAEALRTLVQAVHRVDALVGDIAERMVRERETVARVDADVRGIEQLVQENAAMAGEIGAAAQEQTSATERMTGVCLSLAEHARVLRELVARFRVEEGAGV